MQVLLVEDDVPLAESTASAMRDSGWRVDVSHRGEPVPASVAQDPYDVLVLDLGLPGIDGIETLRRLRAQGSFLPVLILTARDGVEDRVIGLELGADDYLVKPFALDELLARLRALVRRHEFRQDRSSRRRACLKLALACAALAGANGAARAAGPTPENEGPVPRSWPPRQPTPALALPALDGSAVSLAQFAGQPVLLNFWASWCEPCRAEMPALELLEARHAAEGLRVLAVNFRETDAAVRRFVDQTGVTLTLLRDRDGAAAQAFGVRVFPSSVAIGRDGRARFVVVGEVDWSSAQARRWILPLLGPR